MRLNFVFVFVFVVAAAAVTAAAAVAVMFIQKHLEECLYVDIECPNKCGVTLERKEMELHTSKECPKRKVTCEFCQGSVIHTDYKVSS